jgi:hypothetical protein
VKKFFFPREIKDQSACKTPADAAFVRWGTQNWHLARIFTVDNSEIEELNSFRRVSTLNELQSVSAMGLKVAEKKETLPRS